MQIRVVRNSSPLFPAIGFPPFVPMMASIYHSPVINPVIFSFPIFKFKINRIVIGIFQYDKANKKLSLNGSCFISGKCAFVIEEGLKTINYFLVFMGGVILNIVTAIVAFILLYSGINSIFNYSVIICCILNVLANGLYSKSTDRKLLKEYIRKNKGD